MIHQNKQHERSSAPYASHDDRRRLQAAVCAVQEAALLELFARIFTPVISVQKECLWEHSLSETHVYREIYKWGDQIDLAKAPRTGSANLQCSFSLRQG
jgi:hypothetical protein